jgi:uncharacterized protein YndB with AHSA1/START domain
MVIGAPVEVVIRSFFDPGALTAWWGIQRSVTLPRPFGPFVVQWAPTYDRDKVLGRLGGVFRGTVVQFHPCQGFFVADAYWLPPDGDPIGPMALEVACRELDGDTRTELHISQTGFDESDRWRRYYEIIQMGWTQALGSLKALLEK